MTRARQRVSAACIGFVVATLLAPSVASAQAQSADEFDHWTTSFPLTGAHPGVPCASCHVAGVMRGTPSTCVSCHGGQGLRALTHKPANHVRSSNQCDDCHTTTKWDNARFDHVGVAEPCRTCHNGSWAPGQPRDHLPTSNNCEDCHLHVLAWRVVRFNHVGIETGCFRCHNNSRVDGQPRKHLPTSKVCEDCHLSTASFSIHRMNHTGITEGCFACHNNHLVFGQPPGHIPAPTTCEDCHETNTFSLF